MFKTAFLFLFVLSITFFACTDDTLTEIGVVNQSGLHSRTGFRYSDTGTVHNDGLDLVASKTYDWENMSSSEGFDSLEHIIVPFIDAEVETSVGDGEFYDVLGAIQNDHSLSDFNDLYDDSYSDIKSLSGLNSTEINLIDRMTAAYNMNFSGLTDSQVADRLIDSFTVYTSTASASFSVRPEVKAAAYLGLSSISYWDNWGGDTGGVIERFGQVDLVGYLIGWFNAWVEDQGPNYSNSQAAQNARIGKGIRTGLGASTLRMVSIGGSW